MEEKRKPELTLSFDLDQETKAGGELWPGNAGKLGGTSVWLKKWNDKHQAFFPKNSFTSNEIIILQAIQTMLLTQALTDRESRGEGEGAPKPAAKPASKKETSAFESDEIPF